MWKGWVVCLLGDGKRCVSGRLFVAICDSLERLLMQMLIFLAVYVLQADRGRCGCQVSGLPDEVPSVVCMAESASVRI